MKPRILYFTIGFFVILYSCTKQQRIEDALTGTWNIAHYERTKIDTSGNRTTLLSEENVGRWSFYIDTIQAYGYTSTENGYQLFGFMYNGSQGLQYDTGVVMVSEEGRRLILVGPDINTDQLFNIDAFIGNEMLLTRYSSAPNDTAFYELKIGLEKK